MSSEQVLDFEMGSSEFEMGSDARIRLDLGSPSTHLASISRNGRRLDNRWL
jgi:hypothetical protein